MFKKKSGVPKAALKMPAARGKKAFLGGVFVVGKRERGKKPDPDAEKKIGGFVDA